MGVLPDAECVRRLDLNVVEGGDNGVSVSGAGECAEGAGPSPLPSSLLPVSNAKGAVGKPFVLSEGLPPVS